MQQEIVKNQQNLPPSELYYLNCIKLNNSQALMKMQTTHIMLLFFYIDGLHILQKENLLEEAGTKQRIVEYISNLYLKSGGFTSSSLYSKFPKNTIFQQAHIVFTYSAVNCLKILGALDKINKQQILIGLSRHQRQDGSFSSFPTSSECDLRFIYSALSICRIFEDFSHINVQKAKQYIDSCFNFDGGYGLRPKNQSHCGAIYCAIASYQHLKVQIENQRKFKTIKFLAQRQQVHQEDPQLIGVQGRVGKSLDSCYSFWAGASLKMLTGKNLLSPQISKFIMKCYKQDQKSFSKYIQNKNGDPIHTFHSITGLKIIKQQDNNISLAQILRI